MKKLLLVNKYGFVFTFDFPENFELRWAANKIGCEWIEIVRPEKLPDGLVMLIDEEGLLKDRPCMNVFGSWMYGTEAHGHPIVGNVIICSEEEGEDGYDLCGISEEKADELTDMIMEHSNEWCERLREAMLARGLLRN